MWNIYNDKVSKNLMTFLLHVLFDILTAPPHNVLAQWKIFNFKNVRCSVQKVLVSALFYDLAWNLLRNSCTDFIQSEYYHRLDIVEYIVLSNLWQKASLSRMDY